MSKRFSLPFVLTFVLLTFVFPGYAASNQARVRVGNFVNDRDAIDLFTDDSAYATNLAPGVVTEFEVLEPGTYSLSAAPTGETTQDSLISPLSFEAQAGHDYDLALMGQAADNTIHLLVIDQTEAFQGQDILSGSPNIWINNLKGAASMDVRLAGEPILTNIAYGSYGAVVFPARNYADITVTVSGDPSQVILPPITPWGTPSIFYEPSAEYLNAFGGVYSGKPDDGYLESLFNGEDSPQPIIDFLSGFQGLGLSFNKQEEFPFTPQVFEFNTLLSLLDSAGMTNRLTGDGPTVLFAPTDEAFAALPADTLAKIQSDPAMMRDVLSYHIVPGTLSREALASQQILTTLEGSPLTIEPTDGGSFTINGDQAGCGCNYELANGQVFVIDHVLMPPQ